ncbi:MAG: hypothetical protein IJ223_02465 [Clostridia bacterium]|nr:hypothetical protein [Clostridia bacterium]
MNKELREEIREEMKKENIKRKRLIICFLILVLITIIVTIIISNKNTENYISKEEFEQYKNELPITTDNWKDYIELEYEKKEYKDTFGDVIKSEKVPCLKFKKDNIIGYMVLKFIINKDVIDSRFSNEITISVNGNKQEISPQILEGKELTINDMECIQLKGKLYEINIPEDKWEEFKTTRITNKFVEGENVTIEERKYIDVGTKQDYSRYWEYTYLDELRIKETDKYLKGNNN